MMNSPAARQNEKKHIELVYCPMCTHTVDGFVKLKNKKLMVEPGQACAHCHSALDAGYVMRRDRAA